MADTGADPGAESIGGVSVEITGDYSALAGQWSQIQSDAAATGTAVAASFTQAAAGADSFDAAVTAAVASGATLADAVAQTEAAFSSAEAAATDAGAAVDALGGDADSAGSGLDGLAAAADTAGGALDGAAASATGFGGAAEGAGGAAEAADTGLGGMVEQLTAIGEALVITEGLKEFGSEALAASDNVTRASIALTTLTGSADTAHSTIEALEQLGMQDGLSFPNLLTAATRMTQFLGASADVPGILASIANGAAIMGTGIDQAANAFDRAASSGTVAARQLMQIGLSLPALAEAMNAVTGSSDATAQNVAAMFKAMDQADRVQVLQQALSNLAGVAQNVAEQTFGGQWQQLVNAWDQVMIEAGQALLPVISDIVTFMKLDVVPFVKAIADAFTSLPGPVKDVAVALALITAAAVPVLGGLAALGLGIQGLQTGIPLLNGLLEKFGITASATAIEETAAAAATEKLGASAVTASAEIEGAGLAAEGLGTAGLGMAASFSTGTTAVYQFGEAASAATAEAAGLGETAIASGAAVGAGGLGAGVVATGGALAGLVIVAATAKDALAAVKDTASNVAGTVESLVPVVKAAGSAMLDTSGATTGLTDALNLGKAAWKDYISFVENYSPFAQVKDAINTVANAIQLLTGTFPAGVTMSDAMTAALNKFQAAGLTSKAATDALKLALEQYQSGAGATTAAIEAIETASTKQAAAVKTAQAAFDAISNSYRTQTPLADGVVASAGMVTDAQNALAAALKAAGQSVTANLSPMQMLDAAYHKVMDSGTGFASSQQLAADQEQAFTDKSILLNDAVIGTGEKMNLAALQVADLKNQLALGLPVHDQLIAALQNEQHWTDAYNAATAALTGSQPAATKTVKDFADQLSQAHVAYQAMVDGLAAGVTTQAQVAQAWQELQVRQQQYSIAVTGVISQQDLLGQALVDAQGKMSAAMAGYDGSAKSVKALEAAEKELLSAQEALDVSQAEAAANTGDLTSKVNLAAIAYAGAQAKLQDVQAAYAAGTATLQQLISATNAAATAHDALTKAQNAGTGAQNDLVAAMNAYIAANAPYVSATSNYVTGMDQITSAATAATTAVDSLASAMQQVQSDMGATGGGGGTPSGMGNFNLYTPQTGGWFVQTSPGTYPGSESVKMTYQPSVATQQAEAEAAAGQAANPKGLTTPVALAAAVLAEAEQKLKDVVSDFQTQYVATTAQNVQAAQQAVVSAQAALAALQSGASAVTTTATPTTPTTPTNTLEYAPGYGPGGAASSSGTAASTTASSAASALPSGTAMIDEVENGNLFGQLAEIITLLGGPANFAPAIASTVNSINSSTTAAASATTAAAATTSAAVTAAASSLASSAVVIQQVGTAVQAIATAAESKSVTTAVAPAGAVSTPAAIVPSSGSFAPSGTPVSSVGWWTPPPTGGGGQAVNVTLNIAGGRGTAREIQAAAQQGLVDGLRTLGARF